MATKVVLLTTETTHHLYYAWKLNERFPLQAMLVETRCLKAPFETTHPFERLRDAYEREILLGGGPTRFSELAQTVLVDSANAPESLSQLRRLRPEVIVVFGTGKLGPSVIESASAACLNLHGGNPEYYRGLDTHLWTVYHQDFSQLMTTLHYVDEGLDTGAIVAQARLPLHRASQLHELRAVNTNACLELSYQTLEQWQATGTIACVPQRRRGRYFSFMPSALKETCREAFQRYVATLDDVLLHSS